MVYPINLQISIYYLIIWKNNYLLFILSSINNLIIDIKYIISVFIMICYSKVFIYLFLIDLLLFFIFCHYLSSALFLMLFLIIHSLIYYFIFLFDYSFIYLFIYLFYLHVYFLTIHLPTLIIYEFIYLFRIFRI